MRAMDRMYVLLPIPSQLHSRAKLFRLTAHVTARDNLKSALLGSIYIVRDKFRLHDLLTNRMAASSDCKSISYLGTD
jgi:hypothetical protein